MTSPWLDAVWPFVAAHLPAPPAAVLEIGCGPIGGFVPAMRDHGYDATGIDVRAPEGDDYHRMPFEEYRTADPVDAIVACTALHHVEDLDEVLDRAAAALRPEGVVVVVEFDVEQFDERTARWCFDRLPPPDPDAEPGWLARHRSAWADSGGSWDEHVARWAADERLHGGAAMLSALDARFDRRTVSSALPYFFTDLARTTEADEQSAISAGLVRGAGIQYVGRLRRR